MRVFLIDGTYELFRHYFGQPSHLTVENQEVAATRGVLSTVLALFADGATHVGVATDHVIESFRNDLWPGYKDGSGIDPTLLSQFPLLEEGLTAMGVHVWPMVELEADDALGSAAAVAKEAEQVEQVVIMTPDKDLNQCVDDNAGVVQFDRKKNKVITEGDVKEKWGVGPESIPDLLALVGDSADGFPGLAGWGAKSAGAVLARYKHIELIPPRGSDWDVNVRNCGSLASTLNENRDLALLFKELATLRIDRELLSDLDQLRWKGPTDDLEKFCERIDGDRIVTRARELSAAFN